MSRNDIGALLAGLLSAVSAFAVVARDVLWRGVTRVGKSFASLVSSPAVWLAVAACSLGSFWVGHIEGAAGKRALRAEVVTLHAITKSHAEATKEAEARAVKAMAAAKIKDGTIEALKAELARVKARPAVEPVAKKAVPKTIRKKPAVSAPAKPSWNPWS